MCYMWVKKHKKAITTRLFAAIMLLSERKFLEKTNVLDGL